MKSSNHQLPDLIQERLGRILVHKDVVIQRPKQLVQSRACHSSTQWLGQINAMLICPIVSYQVRNLLKERDRELVRPCDLTVVPEWQAAIQSVIELFRHGQELEL